MHPTIADKTDELARLCWRYEVARLNLGKPIAYGSLILSCLLMTSSMMNRKNLPMNS